MPCCFRLIQIDVGEQQYRRQYFFFLSFLPFFVFVGSEEGTDILSWAERVCVWTCELASHSGTGIWFAEIVSFHSQKECVYSRATFPKCLHFCKLIFQRTVSPCLSDTHHTQTLSSYHYLSLLYYLFHHRFHLSFSYLQKIAHTFGSEAKANKVGKKRLKRKMIGWVRRKEVNRKPSVKERSKREKNRWKSVLDGMDESCYQMIP